MAKFKDFVERPIVKKEDLGDKLLLSEATRIEHADIEYITDILKNPRHVVGYALKSYAEHYDEEERELRVEALGGRKRIRITVNADFLELVQEIIDICDDLGYRANVVSERPINTTTIEVYR